jgi:RNA polymerase sigma-70 factor (ECF subfamily)
MSIPVDTRSDSARRLTDAMTRWVDGERDAFDGVYALLTPRLRPFLVCRSGDPTRAEDLLQQTFLRIHAARGSYVRGSDAVPWAFAIARRLLVDYRRRTKHEILFASAEDEAAALDARLERFSVPDLVVEAGAMADRAAAAYATMPEAHRAAYTLVRLGGLDVREAAARLGTTRNAVKLRTHRAYEALRAALDEA